MNLRELFEALEAAPDHTVVMHTPKDAENMGIFHAGDPMSYRGYYDQLAIDTWNPRGKHSRPPTAHELAINLRLMQWEDVHGYKGGTYTITPDTDVWVSAYGSASGWKVSGVSTHLDQVIIETEQESW